MRTEIFIFMLFIIYFVWDQLYKPLFVETTRFRLFSIRDKLFDIGSKYDDEFSTDIYMDLENKINSSIRFCHLLKWSFNSLESRNVPKSQCIHCKIENLDSVDKRKEYALLYEEFMDCLFSQMVLRGMPFFLIFIPLLPLALIVSCITMVVSGSLHIRDKIKQIVLNAFDSANDSFQLQSQ